MRLTGQIVCYDSGVERDRPAWRAMKKKSARLPLSTAVDQQGCWKLPWCTAEREQVGVQDETFAGSEKTSPRMNYDVH